MKDPPPPATPPHLLDVELEDGAEVGGHLGEEGEEHAALQRHGHDGGPGGAGRQHGAPRRGRLQRRGRGHSEYFDLPTFLWSFQKGLQNCQIMLVQVKQA